MDILGLFDLVERVLVVYFTQISLKKASGAIRKRKKRPLDTRQHSGGVRMVSYSAVVTTDQRTARTMAVTERSFCPGIVYEKIS